jgi:hypothetical protein
MTQRIAVAQILIIQNMALAMSQVTFETATGPQKCFKNIPARSSKSVINTASAAARIAVYRKVVLSWSVALLVAGGLELMAKAYNCKRNFGKISGTGESLVTRSFCFDVAQPAAVSSCHRKRSSWFTPRRFSSSHVRTKPVFAPG